MFKLLKRLLGLVVGRDELPDTKKILPEHKQKEKESTIARLRQMISKLELRERAFKKRAQMDYYKAKQYYRIVNKPAAKQHLKKWILLNKYAERYIEYSDRLHNRITMIDQANDVKSLDDTIKMGLVEMKSIQKDVSIEKAERVAAESDAAMAEIDQVGEIYAGTSVDDHDLDKEADQELSHLEDEFGGEEINYASKSLTDPPLIIPICIICYQKYGHLYICLCKNDEMKTPGTPPERI